MKHSLGSLAAVAGLAAASSASGIVLQSPINNLDISTGITAIDIDGNGSNDFFVNSNIFAISGDTPNSGIYIGALSTEMKVLAENEFVNAAGSYNDYAEFDEFYNGGSNFAGFVFERAGDTHYAWLEFYFPDPDMSGALVIGGAWESLSDTGITVGAVPEPGQFALIGGVAALSMTLLRRRRC